LVLVELLAIVQLLTESTLFLEILLLQAAVKAARQTQQLATEGTPARLVALEVAVAQDLLEIQLRVGKGLQAKVMLVADVLGNTRQIDTALVAVVGQVA
jgi:hypothetical protein